MADVKVEVRVEKLSNLKPDEANPRTIKRKEFDKLKKSLTDFPEMKQLREIVVDENLKILAGTQRYYALQELGYTDVTIKQVFNLTEDQKREFMVKDNVSSGDWDTDIIANQWDSDLLQDWGAKFKVDEADETDPATEKAKPSHEVTCPGCGMAFDPKDSE